MIYQPGDIFLTDNRQLSGNTFFARAIAWFGKVEDGGEPTRFTHAGGIVNPDGDIVESLGRVTEGSLEKYLGQTTVRIIRLKDLSDPEKAQIVGWWKSRVGFGYGWRQIARLAGNALTRSTWFTDKLPNNKAANLVCSQLVVGGVKAITKDRYFAKSLWSWSPDAIDDWSIANPDKCEVWDIGRSGNTYTEAKL